MPCLGQRSHEAMGVERQEQCCEYCLLRVLGTRSKKGNLVWTLRNFPMIFFVTNDDRFITGSLVARSRSKWGPFAVSQIIVIITITIISIPNNNPARTYDHGSRPQPDRTWPYTATITPPFQSVLSSHWKLCVDTSPKWDPWTNQRYRSGNVFGYAFVSYIKFS